MSSLVADRNRFSRSPKTGVEFRISSKQLTTHLSQGRSTDLVLSTKEDVEKGLPNDNGPFNLRDCLISSNEANKAAGIQPKHVGVTWEDLQVIVGESVDHKVRTCFVGVGTDQLTFQIDIHQDIRLRVLLLVLGLLSQLIPQFSQLTCFIIVLVSSVLFGDFSLQIHALRMVRTQKRF